MCDFQVSHNYSITTLVSDWFPYYLCMLWDVLIKDLTTFHMYVF